MSARWFRERSVAALAVLLLLGSGCGSADVPASSTTTTSGGMAGAGGAGGVGGVDGSGGMGGAMAGVGGSGGMAGGAPVFEVVPDFSLLDVNPASPTANQPVSPRDYLMRVSAWYFGHAT